MAGAGTDGHACCGVGARRLAWSAASSRRGRRASRGGGGGGGSGCRGSGGRKVVKVRECAGVEKRLEKERMCMVMLPLLRLSRCQCGRKPARKLVRRLRERRRGAGAGACSAVKGK
jgi:hypothetical protein